MKGILFCLRDQKMNMYDRPFVAPTAEMIIRELEDRVQSPRNDDPVGRYPQDFDLYAVGEFNSDSGVITPYSAPKHITSLLALRGNKILSVAHPLEKSHDDVKVSQ